MAAPEEREFSIRIVCMDYYMAPPLPDMDVCYNSFQGQAVAEVPIIRIYGPTLSGQKTCLHVHGSFPYFYVPYGNDLPQNLQDGYNFLHTFASAIEKAMKLNNDVCAKRQHIHSCSLVRAKKFYGYQPSEQLFIKIVLYYPHETGHVAALLMSGGLFNHAFQPFESHIPYLLQFMIDHNLYGMGHIHLSKVKFRNPIPDAILDRRSMFNDTVSEHFQGTKCCLNANMAHLQTQTAVDKNIWLMSNVPSEWLWPVYSFAYVEDTPLSNAQLLKQSICELEGDAFVGDILNQKRLVYSSLSQTGPEVRMVQSLTPIYEELSSMSVSHSKPEKHENLRPSAATVLKTLSHEEHESIILDHFPNHDFRRETLCASSHDAEESKVLQSCQPHKESSRSPTNYDVPSCERPPDVNSEMLSSTQPANEKDCPTHRHDTSQTMQEPTALDAVIDEGVIKSQMSQCPETKDSEGEIVELLRWLSSSQAADGIDVEDGELEENLVSQVLHSNSLEKALEKAKLDYENASQKECEDILYCSKAVEESKCKDEIMPQNQLSENITPEQCHLLIRSNVSIPQLDGCWDEMDRLSEFSSVQRKKKHRKAKSASSSESSKEEQSSAHAVWGSLPLAECEIQNHSAREPCSSSSKDACSFSELSRSSEKEEADLNVESGKNVNGQSLRDLMRKKRAWKPEISESKCYGDSRNNIQRQNTEYVNDNLICLDQGHKCHGSMGLNSSHQACEASHQLLAERSGTFSTTSEIRKCSGKFKPGALDENHPHYRALPLVDKREICFPTESNDKHQSADIHASIHNEKSKCHPAPDLSFPNQRSHTREDKNGFCSLCYNRENDLQEVCRGIASENISHNNIEKGQVSLEEHGKLGHRSLTLNDSLVQKHDDAAFSSSLHPLANEDASYDCNKSITSKKGCNIVEIWDSCTIKSDTSKDLIILSFSTKPPTKEQIEASFGDYSLTPVEHGKPYYGQMPGDISAKMDELTTSTTKFINVKEICPFFSEKTEGKERGMDTKLYMSSEFWDPYRSSDYITGICTDYQNNGSVLYLLTPSMPTPSSSAVKNWLSRNQKNGDDTLVCECSSALAKHNEGDKEMECQASEKPYGHMNACKMHHSPMKSEIRNSNSGERDISQISAPLQPGGKLTPLSQTGFRDPASVGAGQQLTLMSLEVVTDNAASFVAAGRILMASYLTIYWTPCAAHCLDLLLEDIGKINWISMVYAESRGDLQPDPRYDAVNLIVAIVQEDSVDACATTVIIIKDDKANEYSRNIDGISNSDVFYVMDEITLFNVFIELIFIYDPDIIMGWEIQGGSIGYLAERAAYLGVSLLKKISRTPRIEIKHGIPVQDRKDDSVDQEAREIAADASDIHDTIIEDEWGRTHGSGIHIGGRIVLNLWRIMRGELNLRIYTLEAVAESVLRSRVPSIPCRTLTTWFSSGASRARHLCIEHLIDRTKLNLKIMFQLDMINRTSELARVFGIDFFSVLSRGSQYRVESMMLRLAHSQNLLAISPSKQQVALQPAMECLPLVMEPESKFYTDPVVVLDFQSLYPSMIIAYNLCFSTCLGKICPGRTKVLGVTSYNCDSEMLPGIRDNLFITPNGVMYISPQVRSGVLPRLLDEILTTRIMVKNAIKTLTPAQRVLQRVLNARQLALKLIANVTYGYTAAGFSGRMPCAELADSIVQCGRRTLENAINFVNSNSIWNARVVYGDTDSMFVLLKGRTREEAFKIGQEIASAVTARNPYPVTLKTEKVYYPCVLITKKRYVGYSYEHPTQEKPRFDAKGIETVRRDGCLAVAKILERSLRILFESCDLSEVKAYLYRQWQKILTGRISIQDFIFAKEVRLGTYSNNAHSLPPAAIVAMKAMRTDPRAEPRYGERIRYVVVHGEPGSRLGDMVVDPLELVDIHSSHRLHDTYYISKQIIPALQRVFTLVNADVKMWFIEMPRPMRPTLAKRHLNVSSPSGIGHFGGYHGTKTHKAASRSTIDHYYLSQHCIVCGEFIRSSSFVCNNCSKKDCIVAMTLVGRTSKLEKEIEHLTAICRHCGGDDRLSEKEVKCISLDCPVFFERRKVQKEFQVVSEVSMRCGFYPSCSAELF